jgi:hypothetical protein
VGKPEIARKLNTLLEIHQPLTEECQAVYLVVEIRKYLDQLDARGSNFKLLRFYCDWAVHTRKDRHLAHIAPVIEEMYSNARQEIQGKVAQGSAVTFMYFTALRSEMRTFFESVGIDTRLTNNDELWTAYAKLMASILADQPIVEPTDQVRLCTFEPAAENCVSGRIEFTNPIEGANKKSFSYYSFANAY